MPWSDGLTLIASIFVGFATVLAAYFTMTFGRNISTKAEQEIANSLHYPLAERLELLSEGLEETMPSGMNMTLPVYSTFLKKVTRDWAEIQLSLVQAMRLPES